MDKVPAGWGRSPPPLWAFAGNRGEAHPRKAGGGGRRPAQHEVGRVPVNPFLSYSYISFVERVLLFEFAGIIFLFICFSSHISFMTISNFTKIHKKILPLYKLSLKNKKDIFLFKSIIFHKRGGGGGVTSPRSRDVLNFWRSGETGDTMWSVGRYARQGEATLIPFRKIPSGNWGMDKAIAAKISNLREEQGNGDFLSFSVHHSIFQPDNFEIYGGKTSPLISPSYISQLKLCYPKTLQKFDSEAYVLTSLNERTTLIKNPSFISKKKSRWVCYSQSQYTVKTEASFAPLIKTSYDELTYSTLSNDSKSTGANFVQRPELERSGVRGTEGEASKIDLSARSEKEISLEKSVLMSQGLFERQNILQCYKERNLLRLLVAFCDYESRKEPGRGDRGSYHSQTPFGDASGGRVELNGALQQNMFSKVNKKMKTYRSYSILYRIIFYFHFSFSFFRTGVKTIFSQTILLNSLFVGGLRALSSQNRLYSSSHSLFLFQLLIIPYTFLFGILYTFLSFQVSSTLTSKETISLFIPLSKNFVSKKNSNTTVMKSTEFASVNSKNGSVQNFGREANAPEPRMATSTLPISLPLHKMAGQGELSPLSHQSHRRNSFSSGPDNSDLYSYSVQFHSFPYEILRLSHFSSKLFILWGVLTIWKGVRPAKSTRNEYVIQTRLIPARKNKRRFSDVEGIEKFLPVLKTLIESFKKSFSFSKEILQLKEQKLFGNFAAGHGGLGRTLYPASQPSHLKYPKGYLFIGPPGTGKTLLAQAVAGEAKVNLLCLSASEIQKQIDIGTRIGAIRLRNLFEQARKNTPCILFLDEIDAIGRARNEGMDLKLFTEFLIQMDSFSVKNGFLVIGTTNFLSSLDSAFVRSGRFDRILGLNYPGKQTRISILKLYTEKGKNSFDTSICWKSFGERTKGLSAADLSKVVNESALYLIQTKYLGGIQNTSEQNLGKIRVSTNFVGALLKDGGTSSYSMPRSPICNDVVGEPTSRVPNINLGREATAPDPRMAMPIFESPCNSTASRFSNSFSEDRQVSLFQKIYALIFCHFPFISSHKKLIHTTLSLERGLDRICHLSKNSSVK